ncbi:MAG: transcriptional regulator [Pseudonocardiales bacterium]|nr:MAG: transcriptional regulator [Pseudonocardiales bacterium]
MVDMPVGHRSYGQACPVAHALDLIGERWALLVIRELRLGPRRYADLQSALPAISPSVLAQRLRDLELAGVVRKRTLSAPIRAQLYDLTPWGADLEAVFVALARWGNQSPHTPLTGELSDDTVMLGLRTFFRAGPAQWNATFQIHLEHESYHLRVRRGRLVELARAEPPGPVDAVISTSRAVLHALLTGALDNNSARASRQISSTGDSTAVDNLLATLTRPASPT